MKIPFHLFPKNRGEWQQAALFPFQSYMVVAHFVEKHFWDSLPAGGGYRGSLTGFMIGVSFGYIVCAVVLFGVGIRQFSLGHHRSGWLNVGLAVLGCWFAYSMPNLVTA